MTIWEFQATLTRRLLTWAGSSFALGLLMLIGGKFWRGVGSQFAGWAVVNAAIGFFGDRGSTSRRAKFGDQAHDPATLEREGRNLWRLLWINAGLDVFYMLGGWLYARRAGENEQKRGVGIGIVIQGAFLFFFDVYHGLIVPRHQRRQTSVTMPTYTNGTHEAEHVRG